MTPDAPMALAPTTVPTTPIIAISIIAMLRSSTRAARRPSYDPSMANQEPFEPDDETLEAGDDDGPPPRRIAGWQRALRWVAWLTFVGLAIAHSDRDSFGGVEFLALAAAIGVSIFCMAKPLGGPEVTMDEPADVRGAFVSRASWGLVLFGVALTIAGIGAIGAIAYDLSTGRATVRGVR